MSRRSFVLGSLLAAAGIEALVAERPAAAVPASPAAQAAADIRMLRTAAALENLTVAFYTNPDAQRLLVSTGNQFLVAFVTKTVEHHTDHAFAFNGVVTELGGRPQHDIDHTLYEAVVIPGLGAISDPRGLLTLATTLEDIAAQTYTRFAAVTDDRRVAGALASTGPVEAQHSGVLRVAAVIAGVGSPAVGLSLPLDLSLLPASVQGDVVAAAFPSSLYPTAAARDAAEGAGG